MAIPGLAIGIPSATAATLAVSSVLVFLTLCVGHSVGLHRGIIHRTYEAPRAVRNAIAYLFVLSGLGGPLSWARLHAVRDYWQNRTDCPRYFAYRHSMARDFIWNLHLRFEPADSRADHRLPADILGDPWLRFLERTWPLHILGLALAVLAVLGPGAVATCICARTAASITAHWFIGYAAHVWGERRFAIAGAAESGTNVWLLGVLSFGEGFHNNHHAFPTSARMGHRWYELDLGWLVVRALGALRLVWGVRVVPSSSCARSHRSSRRWSRRSRQAASSKARSRAAPPSRARTTTTAATARRARPRVASAPSPRTIRRGR
jgi:stearoyl-CoA desaturase (delta-9 desaturase)